MRSARWIQALIAIGFLCGFWLLPGRVLALRCRALGGPQLDVRPGYSPETLYRLLQLYGYIAVESVFITAKSGLSRISSIAVPQCTATA